MWMNVKDAFSCSVNVLQPPAVLTAVNQSVLTKNGWIILTINLQNIIFEQNSNLSFTQSVFRLQNKVSLIPPEMCLWNVCNKQRVECRIEASADQCGAGWPLNRVWLEERRKWLEWLSKSSRSSSVFCISCVSIVYKSKALWVQLITGLLHSQAAFIHRFLNEASLFIFTAIKRTNESKWINMCF